MSIVEAWLEAACRRRERRGLPELKPLLETLARSTAALRDADREVRAANPARGTPAPTRWDRRRACSTLTSWKKRMTAPPDLRSIAAIAPLLQEGSLSPVDLVRGCLARIDARPELNAFITVMRERALVEAGVAEEEIGAGHYLGPLHGVPVSVKDLIDVAGTPTTAGSALPPRYPLVDAPIVARLREAGAIIIGKTNLHEFAFGTTSEESAFGPVRHPLDPSRSPGGSSGGAAVALVEGMCFGSVGTDTGGSIRIPSAACGTVGLKPTLDELPCEGIVALSGTLDHVGPMARTVADVARHVPRDAEERIRRGSSGGTRVGTAGVRRSGGIFLGPARPRRPPGARRGRATR